MTNTGTLFQPIKIGDITVKNRIIMSGMTTGYANMDGSPNTKLLNHFISRAKGGVGLIVMGATAVSYPEGKICERMIAANDPTITSELHNLADSVHAYGAKIFTQIHHGGFMAYPQFNHGQQSLCASDFAGAREMTIDEIHRVRDDFINAAVNLMNAGMDGVEIHAATMYLLNEFMCPACNQRTDEYGGSQENRFRLVREIIEGVRAACPKPFVVGIRLAIQDFFPGGTTVEEGAVYAKWAQDAGVDYINANTGFYITGMESMETQWQEEGDRVYMGEAVKAAGVTVPVSVNGKLRTPAFCAKIIEEGKTDMVTIGRQLICDPAWANKTLFGKEDTIRPCLNCSQGCASLAFFQHSNIHCQINPYAGFEDRYCESNVSKVGLPKKIAVVGGGVAGMQFAITATKRGHDVTLFEKTDKLGGQMQLACVPPHKQDLGRALEWFRGETARTGVKVVLNTDVKEEELLSGGYEAVVLATGSVPVVPPISGIEKAVESWDILSGKLPIPTGEKILVIGGGVVGAELAHMLCEHECDVTVVEMLPEICRGHQLAHKALLEGYLAEHAHVNVNSRVTCIEDGSVSFINGEGETVTIAVDKAVIAAGHRPYGNDLYSNLLGKGIDVYKIGDAEKVDNIRFATRSALDLAYNI